MFTTQQISELMGFNLPGKFIEETLKVPPDEREKAAKRWSEESLQKIGAALKAHVDNAIEGASLF